MTMICILTSRWSWRISEQVWRACIRVPTNMFPSKPSCFSESIISLNSAHQAKTPSYKECRFRNGRGKSTRSKRTCPNCLYFEYKTLGADLSAKSKISFCSMTPGCGTNGSAVTVLA